ncbi:ATP-binding cassette domain-containing protein [Desulfocurvus sp. DL9XJH121]
MSLVSVRDASLTFGGPLLLDHASLQIEPGQRVCLLGRNGEGKSTLMRILAGEQSPDSGQITRAQGLKVARLPQEVPATLPGTVFDVAVSGIGRLGGTLAAYHAAARDLEADPGNAAALSRLQHAQQALDADGGFEAQGVVDTVLSRLKLDPDAPFDILSGGLKRRALLARALASAPDLLLLDEPTNHLDIESITWLEDFLLRSVKSLVFVTHDRMLLRKLATRIIELDRGRLFDWACDYDTFLARKQEQLDAEDKHNREFDKKLAREEAWIRQGIKARRTRNEGRVRELVKMRRERAARRGHQGEVRMRIQEAERSGKLVAEIHGMTFGYNGQPVIKDFSTSILRGDKVGIIGPNGSGKTTLLGLLLGKLAPQSGDVRLGTNLEIAYFDQHRAELDPDKSVRDNVAQGNDVVTVGGRTQHVVGYLKDFLFPPDRTMVPVSVLSGGERNRLLLAKLFTRPANVLVLDEPTNDLDAETLDLLEERLLDFSGTVLVVSHDRAFLNNVATSTLALESHGVVHEYVGGYDDWLRQRPEPEPEALAKPRIKPVRHKAAPSSKRKLTYAETRERDQLARELDELPARMDALEEQQTTLQNRLSDPAFMAKGAEAISTAAKELQDVEAALEQALERWEWIENRLEKLTED